MRKVLHVLCVAAAVAAGTSSSLRAQAANPPAQAGVPQGPSSPVETAFRYQQRIAVEKSAGQIEFGTPEIGGGRLLVSVKRPGQEAREFVFEEKSADGDRAVVHAGVKGSEPAVLFLERHGGVWRVVESPPAGSAVSSAPAPSQAQPESMEEVCARVASGFLQGLKSGDLRAAYACADKQFRDSAPPEALRGFLARWPLLSGFAACEWSPARNHRGVGLITASLRGDPGQEMKVGFELRSDDGGWLVSLIGIHQGSEGFFAEGGQLPAPSYGDASPPQAPAPGAASPGKPDIGARELGAEEIRALSSRELRLLRNEIFARHGLIFESADLRKHFSAFPWYRPAVRDLNESDLSPVERANLKAIQAEEARRR